MLPDPVSIPTLNAFTLSSPAMAAFAATSFGVGQSIRKGPDFALTSGARCAQKVTISHSKSNENASGNSASKVDTDRTLIRIDYEVASIENDAPRKAFAYIVIGAPRSEDLTPAEVASMLLKLVGLTLTKDVSGTQTFSTDNLLRIAAGEA